VLSNPEEFRPEREGRDSTEEFSKVMKPVAAKKNERMSDVL